jgi:Ca2+-binding RTX toxin-like protein
LPAGEHPWRITRAPTKTTPTAGTAASDLIEGFGGDDWLKDGPAFASAVADQIFGGTGNDIISIAGGADTISGGQGQDRLVL